MSPPRLIINLHSYCFLRRSETDSLNEQKERSHARFIVAHSVPPSAAPGEKWGQKSEESACEKNRETTTKWLNKCFGGTETSPSVYVCESKLPKWCWAKNDSCQMHGCRPIKVLGAVVYAVVYESRTHKSMLIRQQTDKRAPLKQLHKLERRHSLDSTSFEWQTNKNVTPLIFMKMTSTVGNYYQSHKNRRAGSRIIDGGSFRSSFVWMENHRMVCCHSVDVPVSHGCAWLRDIADNTVLSGTRHTSFFHFHRNVCHLTVSPRGRQK